MLNLAAFYIYVYNNFQMAGKKKQLNKQTKKNVNTFAMCIFKQSENILYFDPLYNCQIHHKVLPFSLLH